MSENPFYEESSLLLQAPPFDKIKFEHYEPAFIKGMENNLAEIEEIKKNSGEPTFENTIIPLEKSGNLLYRVRLVFDNLCASNTTPEMQKLQEEYAPKFAAHADKIFLDSDLFQRVHQLYEKISSFTDEEKKIIEFYEKEFKKAGADLPPDEKKSLKQINERLAELEATFGNMLLSAREKTVMIFDNPNELRGLSEDELNKAKETAVRLGHNGKYALYLTNTTQQPVTAQIEDGATRKLIFETSVKRCEQKNGVDTRPLIEEIAKLRLQKAHLLSKECFTDWALQGRMATQETAIQLLEEMGKVSEAKFNEEVETVKNIMGLEKLEPCDWVFYAEQAKRKQFDADETKMSEYFELDSVLEKGVFYTAENLYGLKFKKTEELPVYHEDVRAYKVFEESGDLLALYYLDPFARSNKQGGAWMSNFVEQSSILKQKPVVVNVTNFPKPSNGQPCLLSFRNVTTLFHEFGHGLHGMLSNLKYRSLSGTAVARDFLEFPSQINEHWATFEPVLHNYAIHHKSKEVIPDDMVKKMQEVENFTSGFDTLEVVKAAIIDMHWHVSTKEDQLKPTEEMEVQALKVHNFNSPLVPPRYHSTYFSHIFQGGYASSYYVYQWARVLDCDGFEWFLQNGGMNRSNGDHLRHTVLSVGNSIGALDAYKSFAGRTASMAAFLKKNGFRLL